jgi:hypothetical protein
LGAYQLGDADLGLGHIDQALAAISDLTHKALLPDQGDHFRSDRGLEGNLGTTTIANA